MLKAGEKEMKKLSLRREINLLISRLPVQQMGCGQLGASIRDFFRRLPKLTPFLQVNSMPISNLITIPV